MAELHSRRVSWRTVSVLLVGAVLGAAVISPGVGLAAKFLTKKKADNRYLNTDEAYTKAQADTQFLTDPEADARFLTQSEADSRYSQPGPIVLFHNGPWGVSENSNGTTVSFGSRGWKFDPDAGSSLEGTTNLVAPVEVGGSSYGLQQVEICYRTPFNAPDKVDQTRIESMRDQQDPVVLVSDLTDRTSVNVACYTVAVPAPSIAQGSLTLAVRYDYADFANFMEVRSVTTTWIPV